MSKVHYKDRDSLEGENYVTKIYSLCGRVVEMWNPRKHWIDTLEWTTNEEDVTCKQCKKQL